MPLLYMLKVLLHILKNLLISLHLQMNTNYNNNHNYVITIQNFITYALGLSETSS